MEGMPIWLSTTLLGLGTVFVGLICLIYITKLMSALCASFKKEPPPAPVSAPAAAGIADRGAFAAAVSAAIASVMGAEVDGLRIVSVKKVD
ncbi:MAG: OadG family protein [Clostridia bacterium]|nr:OadG family protein [Clostridia bacterium]